MQDWFNRKNFFKFLFVLLVLFVIKLLIDRRNIEEKLISIISIKTGLNSDNIKNLEILNENKLYEDVKNNLNILNDNLGKSIKNLQNFAELSAKFENVNKELSRLGEKKLANNKGLEEIAPSNSLTNNEIVKVFDLNKPLEPAQTYNPIQCRRSREVVVITTLCIHDINKDVHVSGSIWRDGVWELHIISYYMQIIKNHPDWLVLDIGAQIGQYSLFPAKFGSQVLTVEPFYDNIIRLHKAAKTESIANRIKLITNAISNKKGEIKMLQPASNNIGGQSLVENINKEIKKEDIKEDDPNAKYYVETVLFNDIVSYLPVKEDGKKYEKAVMKIDIEAFEPYAFQHAEKLFDELDIPIILMEWGNLPSQKNMIKEIEEMLDFLYSRNYTSYGDNVALNRNAWKFGWPWDIIWKKMVIDLVSLYRVRAIQIYSFFNAKNDYLKN